MLRFFKNLLIFGEGGDGGAGAATGGAPAGQAAENTGVSVPDAGEQRRLTREERRTRLEERLRAEQAQAQPQQPQQTQEAPEAKRPLKELIKGEYKQEFDEYVQNLLNGRFKGVREAEARSNRMEEMFSRLVGNRYDLKPGEDGKLDLDAVQKAMDEDDDLYENLAVELGTSVEYAKKYDAMQKKIQQADRERAEQERYAQFMYFQNAALEAQKTFPDMNVEETSNDPRFRRLLEVLSPAAAYHALHQVELTSNAMQYAVDTTKAGIASSIQAGQNRPAEGGLGRRAPTTTNRINKSPREMTKAERVAYNRRAARGEEVIF